MRDWTTPAVASSQQSLDAYERAKTQSEAMTDRVAGASW